MLVTHQNPLTRSPHAMLLVMFFEALEARNHRGVLFRLSFLRAKGVVGERVQANGLWLIRVESFGDNGSGLKKMRDQHWSD